MIGSCFHRKSLLVLEWGLIMYQCRQRVGVDSSGLLITAPNKGSIRAKKMQGHYHRRNSVHVKKHLCVRCQLMTKMTTTQSHRWTISRDQCSIHSTLLTKMESWHPKKFHNLLLLWPMAHNHPICWSKTESLHFWSSHQMLVVKVTKKVYPSQDETIEGSTSL